MLPSSQGARVHPAVGEARQQRLTLARLLATMQTPGLDVICPRLVGSVALMAASVVRRRQKLAGGIRPEFGVRSC